MFDNSGVTRNVNTGTTRNINPFKPNSMSNSPSNIDNQINTILKTHDDQGNIVKDVVSVDNPISSVSSSTHRSDGLPSSTTGITDIYEIRI